MQKIHIISVGNVKNPQIQKLIDQYFVQTQPYLKIKTSEVKSIPFRNVGEKDQVTQKESKALLQKITKGSPVILLTEHGTTLSSKQFAKNLLKWSDHGQKELTFLIAGPLGMSEELKKQATHLLSLSPMTFPHEIAQLMLYEQLYRAATILNNKTYHY